MTEKAAKAQKIPQTLLSMQEIIGNTPLLAITFRLCGPRTSNQVRTIYAKAEHLNLTGSIKDRMALHILRHAYSEGLLRPGDAIVEATSGNTGISFAALGRALGHPVVIYMPDWMSRERIRLMESYGARVELVSRQQDGFLGSIRLTEDQALREPDCFLPRQFANAANWQAHALSTGPELIHQLASLGLAPDAFVAGVGTGGTAMGLLHCLRNHGLTTRVHPVEPAESPTLSTGHKVGSHRIQGISDEFIPSIVALDQLDPVLPVSDGDSILMAQKLAAQLGLAVGISSGCNFLAAVMAQNQLSPTAVVATVFPDDNKKYLSTDLVRTESVRDGYLSPEIELLDYRVVQRPPRTAPHWPSADSRTSSSL
jgi:cysteine synthase A